MLDSRRSAGSGGAGKGISKVGDGFVSGGTRGKKEKKSKEKRKTKRERLAARLLPEAAKEGCRIHGRVVEDIVHCGDTFCKNIVASLKEQLKEQLKEEMMKSGAAGKNTVEDMKAVGKLRAQEETMSGSPANGTSLFDVLRSVVLDLKTVRAKMENAEKRIANLYEAYLSKVREKGVEIEKSLSNDPEALQIWKQLFFIHEAERGEEQTKENDSIEMKIDILTDHLMMLENTEETSTKELSAQSIRSLEDIVQHIKADLSQETAETKSFGYPEFCEVQNFVEKVCEWCVEEAKASNGGDYAMMSQCFVKRQVLVHFTEGSASVEAESGIVRRSPENSVVVSEDEDLIVVDVKQGRKKSSTATSTVAPKSNPVAVPGEKQLFIVSCLVPHL